MNTFSFSSAVFVQKALLLLFFLGMVSTANGQIISNLNEQMYRPELYNSSAMALKDHAQVYFNQRTDYIGETVQPLTFVLGGNAPALLNGRLVLGGQMVFRRQQNGEFFKSTETESAFRLAYRLLDTDNHKVALGVSTAIATVNFTYSGWFGGENNLSRIELGTGASYQYTKDKIGLKLGASLAKLPVAQFSENGFKVYKNTQLFSSASFSYSFGDWKVEPIILLNTYFYENYSEDNKTVADFGARFHYKDLVWFGGGARTQKNGGHFEIGGKPGGKLQKRLAFFASANITTYTSTSLEFGIGYTFKKKTADSQ